MNENIRIAIYIRLSMADEDTGKEKDESNSVVNQRSLIHRFLDNHEELSLYPRTEFVDDGFSGTNTDRPAYQNLMNQLNEGKFQVLITKDFSRANRDYLEMGELIEYTVQKSRVSIHLNSPQSAARRKASSEYARKHNNLNNTAMQDEIAKSQDSWYYILVERRLAFR